MARVIEIDGIEAEPGQRATHIVCVPVGKREVEVPVMVVNGRQDGPRVAITAGVHGAEYVGIETARRLGCGIDAGSLTGSLVVVPIVNTTAFYARSMYISPLDGMNINRVFPGNPLGGPSEVLAHWVFEQVIRPSQYYIDLHGGDLIEALAPFALYASTDDERVERVSREMAVASGIRHVVRTEVGGAAYGAATAAGIPSFIGEIGAHGLPDQSLVEAYETGIINVLRYLEVLPRDGYVEHAANLGDTLTFVRAPERGLFYPDTELGSTVRTGQRLGAIRDYFGLELHVIEAPLAGEIVVVVTSLATNAGDILIGIVA